MRGADRQVASADRPAVDGRIAQAGGSGGGRVALVTGASSGLGRALSVELTDRGVTVIGVARRPDSLAATGALCAGGLFHPLTGDVRDAQRLRDIVAQAEQRIGPIDILINNAAVYRRHDFLAVEAEAVVDELAINLNGYVNAASAVLPGMAARGRGRIVNVSSFAGGEPLAGSLGYSVSKAAVRALTPALAAETRARLPDIVISEWLPGVLRTGMGLPDSLDPATAAVWGANLALDNNPALHGAVFLRDRQLLPPRGTAQRLKDLLLMRLPVQPLRL